MPRVAKVEETKEQMARDKVSGKYAVDLTEESDRREFYKEKLEEFEIETVNTRKLWNVFTDNVLEEEFKWSRRSALNLIFFPTIINLYFFFIKPGHLLKNPIRIASIVVSFGIFKYNLNKDYEELVKKDTTTANRTRSYIQNLAKVDMSCPDYYKETIQVIGNISPALHLLIGIIIENRNKTKG